MSTLTEIFTIGGLVTTMWAGVPIENAINTATKRYQQGSFQADTEYTANEIAIALELVGGSESLRAVLGYASDIYNSNTIASEPITVPIHATSMRWPVVPTARISSRFGDRTHPITGVKQHHNGVDIAVPRGTAVAAAGKGEVVATGEDGVAGRYVIINHGEDVITSYSHGEKILVQAGDKVEAGETIMLSGSSGRSTGPHLHFSLRLNGNSVDPTQYIRSTVAQLLHR